MKNIISLNKNGQFKRVYGRGKQSVHSALVVYAHKNGLGVNRLGITASKKIGKAHVRNRAKRRIRELYLLRSDDLKYGFDIVVVARFKTADIQFKQLETAFSKACVDLGILKPNEKNYN